MKKVFSIILKSALVFACVFLGIYIECILRDRRLLLFLSLAYSVFVPVFICDMMSRKKKKRGELSWGIFGFTLIAVVLFFVLCGISWVVTKIFTLDGSGYFYVIYTILVYAMAIFTAMAFGGSLLEEKEAIAAGVDISKDEPDVEVMYAKTTRTSWIYVILIHVSAKFLFMTENSLGAFKYLITPAIIILLLLFGVLRDDIVYLSDEIWRKKLKIATNCPVCQNKFKLPIYICPNCGRKHGTLQPNEEGAKRITCACGEKLPTTFKGGKDKLDSLCPYCGAFIKDGGKHVDIVIPIIGGASSGKTCFIHQAIASIASEAHKYSLSYESAMNEADEFESNIKAMENGTLPEKTGDMRLKYFQFYLTPEKINLKNLVSVCDIGGEAYAENEAVSTQLGFKHADAFLMILDPLSIYDFRQELSEKLNLAEYGASSDNADEVMSRFISIFENMLCMSAKEMLTKDIAVVLTKCDIPGLDGKIGKTAIENYRNANPSATYLEARNAVCKAFLTEYGEANLLNTLKSKFKTVQFFSASSLGHKADGTPFRPDSILDPLLWIVDKVSLSIDLSDKWNG